MGIMPGAAVGVGLSAVKTSFDLIRSLRELLTKPEVNPDEVQARLLEIQALLIDAQKGLADAEDENRLLRGRIEELERSADFGKDFTFEEGVYWYRDYPYCPNCWDRDRKATRLDGPYVALHDVNAASNTKTLWKCMAHASMYYLKRRSVHQ